MADHEGLASESWDETFTHLRWVDVLPKSETLVWRSSRGPKKLVAIDCYNGSDALLAPGKSYSAHLDPNILCRAAVFNPLLFTRDETHPDTPLSESAKFRKWTSWHCEACQLYANAILIGSSLRLREKILPVWHRMLITQPSAFQVDIVCTSREASKTVRNEHGVILKDIIDQLDDFCIKQSCYVLRIPEYVVLAEDERNRMNDRKRTWECLASSEEDCAFRITRRTKELNRAGEGVCLSRLEELRQITLTKGEPVSARTLCFLSKALDHMDIDDSPDTVMSVMQALGRLRRLRMEDPPATCGM